ncbi:MAG TPA: ABC transporter permease, partial [Methanomassiliicoccales archaeon]|nr:ABC transporter permease [Methanomassiliicoccales archaeon]
MANRIVVALKGEVKTFWRNKSTIFWTVAFPVLLILLFGAIFSGGATGKVDIAVQDLSDTTASHMYINSLLQTGSVSITNVSKDV